MALALAIATALYGAAIFAVTVLFLRHLAALERRQTRRVDDLLNRLAHANGRTWVPAPVQEDSRDGPPARVLDLVDADQEM